MYKFYDNKNFCHWLFTNEYYTAIAHNLKGYDGVFIMKYIIDSFTSKDNLFFRWIALYGFPLLSIEISLVLEIIFSFK